MSFIEEKFRFIYRTPKNSDVKEIIALGEYRGKTVKGVAKCDPRDTFVPGTGEKLAARRCNLKIADKRLANAERKVAEAKAAYEKASRELAKSEMYLAYATSEYSLADKELSDLICELN